MIRTTTLIGFSALPPPDASLGWRLRHILSAERPGHIKATTARRIAAQAGMVGEVRVFHNGFSPPHIFDMTI